MKERFESEDQVRHRITREFSSLKSGYSDNAVAYFCAKSFEKSEKISWNYYWRRPNIPLFLIFKISVGTYGHFSQDEFFFLQFTSSHIMKCLCCRKSHRSTNCIYENHYIIAYAVPELERGNPGHVF